MACLLRMFVRLFLAKVTKRFRIVFGMGANYVNVKRCFIFGLGAGAGIALVVFLARKLDEQSRNHELVRTIDRMKNEMKELRLIMVQHFQTTASDFSNERLLTKTKERNTNLDIVVNKNDIKEMPPQVEDSSSEDDFFDFDDEDISIDSNELNNSLQENFILNLDEILKKCDHLSGNNNIKDNETEINMLEDLLFKDPDNVEVLFRCARAYKRKSDLVVNAHETKEACFEGLRLAERAIDVAEDHYLARKWYGILLGMSCQLRPLSEQITYAYKFQEAISKSIELNPKDSINYYLLGRWCYGIANLSWWERRAAATLFGEPPTSSYEEALKHFQQAEELGDGSSSKGITLFMAKCHHNLGNPQKAKELLRKSLDLSVNNKDDQTAHDEANILLTKLS